MIIRRTSERTGARGRVAEAADGPPGTRRGRAGPATGEDRLPVTWRGYDRIEVDVRIESLTTQLVELAAANEQERNRAAHAERELRDALARLRSKPNTPGGFERWVDDLLRQAEEDAARMRAEAAADVGTILERARAQAAAEAAAALERARADAEAHRREVEHSLRARTVKVGQELANKQMELDAQWQRHVSGQAAAEQDVARIREDAEAWAGELRQRCAVLLHHLQETVDQEVRRACSPYEHVRRELVRLQELMTAAATTPPVGRARHEDPYGETADGLTRITEVAVASDAEHGEVAWLASAG